MKNSIKELRKAAGLTQGQLAELADTSRAQIARLETGHRRVSGHWAVRLAPHLNVMPYEVFMARSEADAGESASCSPEQNRPRFWADDPDEIRGRVKAKGLTQQQVADALGIQRTAVSNILTGKRSVKASEAAILADLLDEGELGKPRKPQAAFDEWGHVALQVLELEGVERGKAATIVEIMEAAVGVLESLPSEGDRQTRAKIAAHAAWQIRNGRPRDISQARNHE